MCASSMMDFSENIFVKNFMKLRPVDLTSYGGIGINWSSEN